MEPGAMTDIQRAVRFYYLLKTGYASKIVDPCFVISTFRKPAFNLLRIKEELSTAHLKLSAVAIDNKPYEKFISKYDKPHVFFYLDPPYFGMENYYGKNIFHQDDFRILASMLSKISGKFIMSINNHKTIHEIFKDFNHRKVNTRYNVSNKSKRVEELLIMNY